MEHVGLSLRDGMDLAGIDIGELWQRYLAIGGNGSERDLSSSVSLGERLNNHEHNVIAQAINESFLDRGEDPRVGYRLA